MRVKESRPRLKAITTEPTRSAQLQRLLVLGLDAADRALIEKWADEGILPTLNYLRREGAWITLTHNHPMPSASVWPSIYTGTHPGKHGIYNGLQLKPGKQAVDFIKPNQCAQPPFWKILDKTGIRSIIMDVPFNYPLQDFSGIQILDWGTYERHYESQSLPGAIITEISKRFGVYPFSHQMSRDVPLSVRHRRRVRSQLLAGVRLKGSVVKWLMSQRSWDFLMTVFGETHPAGHYFWNFHSDVRQQSGSATPEFATTIKEIYKATDDEIAKIIDGLDERTTFLILSGQGMGPNCAKWHLIPELLSRLGYLVSKSKHDRRRKAQINWFGEMRDFIPLSWRRRVSQYLAGSVRDYLRVYWANSRIDWSQTRAYHLPTDLYGYIRINLKGREPRGIVEPGSEYNEICSRIREVLKTLVNPHTGKPIVREIYHTDQIFPGPQRERLPDLLVDWQDEPVLNGAYSDQVGQLNGKVSDLRSGNHTPKGFAIFYGPGIGKQQASEAHIVDIAPTILQYFGVKPTVDFDGKPLVKVFSWRGEAATSLSQREE